MGGENCFTSTWQWSREGMLIHSWGSSNALPPRGLSLVLSSKPGPRMSQGKGALSISRGNLGHFFSESQFACFFLEDVHNLWVSAPCLLSWHCLGGMGTFLRLWACFKVGASLRCAALAPPPWGQWLCCDQLSPHQLPQVDAETKAES